MWAGPHRLAEHPGEVEPAQCHRGGQVVQGEVLAQVGVDVVAYGALLPEGEPLARIDLAEQHVRVPAQDVHGELAGQGVDQQPATGPTLGRLPGDGHGGGVDGRVVRLDLVQQGDV